jgi:hypothetical protein
MKVLHFGKDGGPESNVSGFWLVEIKRWFSIALLRFDHGSREAFHSHAFNSVSWLIKGCLVEQHLNDNINDYHPSFWPILTRRFTFHRVFSFNTSWVLTFRGPWAKNWQEFNPKTQELSILTNGRVIVDVRPS